MVTRNVCSECFLPMVLQVTKWSSDLFRKKALEGEHGQGQEWKEHWEDEKLLPAAFLGKNNRCRTKWQSMSHCENIFSFVNKHVGSYISQINIRQNINYSQAIMYVVMAITQQAAAFGTGAWSNCSDAEDVFLFQNSPFFFKLSILPLAKQHRSFLSKNILPVVNPCLQSGGMSSALPPHNYKNGIPCHVMWLCNIQPSLMEAVNSTSWFYSLCKKLFLFYFYFCMLSNSSFKRDKLFQFSVIFLQTTRNSYKTELSHGIFAKA